METAEVARVRDRLRYDTPFWSKHCATILTTDKREVRLVARPWQLEFDAALEKQRAAGQPMRAIILKARKLGFSTWVAAKFTQRVTQFPNRHAVVAAQDRKTAGTLMDMVARMYAKLPTEEELGLGFSVKPQITGKGETRNGARFMTFGDRMRPVEASLYETLTAGSSGSGRGSTPDMFHASEAAWYEDPNFLVGALTAVPQEPETIIVVESTAHGFNNFHTMWERAVSGAEDPDLGGFYTPLFFGWHDNPFNARQFISEEARDRFEKTLGDPDAGGDEEELLLLEQFGVTLEQLFWRRTTINGLPFNGDVEQFHQEHPSTPEQAFIGSGQPVFPGILVARALKEAARAERPVEGVLRGAEHRERKTRRGTVLVPQKALWVPDPGMEDEDLWMRSRLMVWQHPVNQFTQQGLQPHERHPDGQYVIFADVALGSGNVDGDGDWHAAQVLDHITRRQVARYRSRVPLHDLPEILALLGLYYNEAWLAVEINGPGVAVVDALRQEYRYRKLYRRRTRGDSTVDGPQGSLVGWQTTLSTKPLLEQTFGQALKDGDHGLRDVATGREFTTYVEDPKNPAKHGAQKGAHDDLAISFMGAHRVAAELRPRDAAALGRSARGRRVADDVTGY